MFFRLFYASEPLRRSECQRSRPGGIPGREARGGKEITPLTLTPVRMLFYAAQLFRQGSQLQCQPTPDFFSGLEPSPVSERTVPCHIRKGAWIVLEFLLTTERLLLRPFIEGDAEILNRIANQDYVLKWMPDWESSVEDTRKLIRYFISQYPLANKEDARVMFAVTLSANNEIIGMVGVGNKEEVDNEIEIAYFISERFASTGYITEAVKTVSQWALEYLKLDYLIAIVELDNYPSQKVVERCGFERLETRMILNSGESEEKPFYYYRLYPRHKA